MDWSGAWIFKLEKGLALCDTSGLLTSEPWLSSSSTSPSRLINRPPTVPSLPEKLSTLIDSRRKKRILPQCSTTEGCRVETCTRLRRVQPLFHFNCAPSCRTQSCLWTDARGVHPEMLECNWSFKCVSIYLGCVLTTKQLFTGPLGACGWMDDFLTAAAILSPASFVHPFSGVQSGADKQLC